MLLQAPSKGEGACLPDSEHRIRERAYAPKDVLQDHWERAKASINNGDSEKQAAWGEEGNKAQDVPQADVAAEREIAERAGNQQQPAAPHERRRIADTTIAYGGGY
jgi:hypothetical protein